MKLDRVIAVRNNKTIFRDGDRCIKVFEYGYSKTDVLNEALSHAKIEETGIMAPKLLEVTSIDGKWAIVTEFIKGKTLSQLMEENPEKRSEYIDLMADLQLEINSKQGFELRSLKNNLSYKIMNMDLDDIVRFDLLTRLEGMTNHNNICHGDLNPSNIIIDEAGTPYIIDWAHAMQGQALADAATTYLLFLLNGDVDAAGKYLEKYCEKSDTDKQYIMKLIPVVAVSQYRKGNEKEREFMSKWISTYNTNEGEIR